ncbi:MAG: GNAT family N-acetyltransferase [Saprospiraceae bacterium]
MIRQEQVQDYEKVFKVIEAAFKNIAYSDQSEPFLVNRLRESDAFIPELSLVAIVDGEIVGHILLTKILIENKNETFQSLALAPVSVVPNYQGQGIGSQLIKIAHQKAKTLGYESIILLGHENYYPRFGYRQTTNFGIKLPFDVPKENSMAIELVENALQKVSGTVVYPKAFFE